MGNNRWHSDLEVGWGTRLGIGWLTGHLEYEETEQGEQGGNLVHLGLLVAGNWLLVLLIMQIEEIERLPVRMYVFSLTLSWHTKRYLNSVFVECFWMTLKHSKDSKVLLSLYTFINPWDHWTSCQLFIAHMPRKTILGMSTLLHKQWNANNFTAPNLCVLCRSLELTCQFCR